MQKKKKTPTSLPKNIQLTFITAAAVAFVINAIYWISMLIRVYPNGMRLSQFSILAFGQILLPAVLFVLGFVTYKKSITRFDHIVNAVLLTFVGLGIYLLTSTVEGLLSRYQNISSSLVSMTWAPAVSMIITLCLFGALLLVLYPRNKKVNHARRLQLIALAVIALAFLVGAAFNFSGLVSQHVGNNNILALLTHPLLITPVVLPIAFFLTAYFALEKSAGRLNQLFTAAMYALVGAMVIWITAMVFQIGAWTLPPNDFASLHKLGLPTIFATVISLAVYTFLIVTHNRSKKTTKRTK